MVRFLFTESFPNYFVFIYKCCFSHEKSTVEKCDGYNEQKSARLLQCVVFLDMLGTLFCSFVQQQQFELRTFTTYSKRQNLIQNEKKRRPEPEKHTMGALW